MHYTFRKTEQIRVQAGDMVEVLEAFYLKYMDEIVISRVRINGRLYQSRPIDHSCIDLMPLKPHEGFVEKVQASDRQLALSIRLFDTTETPADDRWGSPPTRH